jgi:hypothetical protein
MTKTIGYLRLIRPANVITSIADVLAGIAISGFLVYSFLPGFLWHALPLCISTIGLYAGGVAFNDIFDADLDRLERPERPIPSGLISIKKAIILASFLLLSGILAAFLVNPTAGILALLITGAALIYNKWGKHHLVLGPLNMGLCRGLNLLLGISILPSAVLDWWYLALVPIVYISSITMISRGEVHGSGRRPLYLASFLYLLVIAFILYFSFINGMVLLALIFIISFAWMIFRPLIVAIELPNGPNIGKAVKGGVISLIIMDAAWAAASGELTAAMIIILLLPISVWLGRLFAVT